MELTDEIVRTGGNGEPDEHVPRDDGAQVEGAGPLFYFFMNRGPGYVVTFLNKRRQEQPRGSQLHPAAHRVHDVPRVHQLHREGQAYKSLAGNDGTVASRPNIDKKKVMGC